MMRLGIIFQGSSYVSTVYQSIVAVSIYVYLKYSKKQNYIYERDAVMYKPWRGREVGVGIIATIQS
jgi:hypothetical protein